MISMRNTAPIVVIGTGSGGAGQTIATGTLIEVGPLGLVSVHCVVDDGNGAAPTGSPSGALHLYATSSRNTAAPALATMPPGLVASADADLATISPAGDNALVNGLASFECMPGAQIMILYTRASGGGAGSRLRLGVVTS